MNPTTMEDALLEIERLNTKCELEYNKGYIQGYNEGYMEHQSETMEQIDIQKKQLANIHRVSNNICGNKYSLKLHCLQRWKKYTHELRRPKRMLITPITTKSRPDYNEQMERIKANDLHLWDDSVKNNSEIGDYFGYVVNGSIGKIDIYKIIDISSPKDRLISWSNNVGQENRNVITLSQKCYYSGTLKEYKEILNYKDNWNSQGTQAAAINLGHKYIRHVINSII